MTCDNRPAAEEPNLLARMLGGYRETQLLYVVAKLRIADRLAQGPKSARQLATESGANADALYRVLRVLAGLGVFHEIAGGEFELTQASQLLRSDAAGSLHALAVTYGEPWWWQAWGKTLDCVQHGATAFELHHGRNIFDFLQDDPAAAAVFNANMAATTASSASAIVSAADWEFTRTVVDVGGGRGALLDAILRSHEQVCGVLFDRPSVVEEAAEYLGGLIGAGRCEVVSGDIFTSLPQGADTYIMKEILHDWDDSRCLAVLCACRAAMPHNGRLLLVERMIGPTNVCTEGKMIDIAMLVMAGGKERTLDEYRTLLERAGMCLRQTRSTSAGLDVMEAGPA
jgi:hypothetical protein